MLRNKEQNKRLYTLLSKLGIDNETKQDLVHQFTKGRTSHSSKMLMEECQALINHLQVTQNQRVQVSPDRSAVPSSSEENQMRRKIISACHEMNWKKNGQIDWERLNNWMVNRSYLKKPMKEYTLKELPKLVTQFDLVKAKFYAAK